MPELMSASPLLATMSHFRLNALPDLSSSGIAGVTLSKALMNQC